MGLFKAKIAELIKEKLPPASPGLDPDEVALGDLLEAPPDPAYGDMAFPTFSLARTFRRAPAKIAADLAAEINRARPDWLEKVEALNGYVNFTLNKPLAARSVLTAIKSEGRRYGSSGAGQGRKVVIDFSSPNIAKPFAVNLLRTTVLGQALSRLYAFQGYEVVRVNHLGDWGTQNGQWIVGYRLWGDEAALAANPIKELLRLYIRFHEEAEKHPELEDQAREAFHLLEQGDPEALALWKRFRHLSIEEFKRVYARMGIEFDSYAGEAFYSDKMEPVIRLLQEKGMLVESEGATVAPLDEYNLPPCLILKSDGSTLYPTRDLAAALYRWEQYQPALVLYVVDVRQSLHFQQIFTVLKKAGMSWVDRYEHIAYGLIKFQDMIMSTRKGAIVFLEDVLDEAANRSLEIIKERNPDLPDKEKVAEQVGIGAIIFRFLIYSRLKEISFDWQTALSFDGDTGPYVQYTYARLCSILRKAGTEGVDVEKIGEDPSCLCFEKLSAPEEAALILELERFPDVLIQCEAGRDPVALARYLLELCRVFNGYYHQHRVMGSDAMAERLFLLAGVRTVLQNGLYLLGMSAPEEM